MSQEATAWVWLNSETRGIDRLVFLALAHNADTNGEGVVPSYPTIATVDGELVHFTIPRLAAHHD